MFKAEDVFSIFQKVIEINEKFKKTKLNLLAIGLILDHDYLIDNEMQNLKKLNSLLQKENIALFLDIYDKNFSSIKIATLCDDYLISKTKLDNFIKKLNDMTITENGTTRPLAVFEKFMIVYRFVSN